MRRVSALALIAGGAVVVVAGGAFARARVTGRGSAIPKPVTGMFSNGMAYLGGAPVPGPAVYPGRSRQRGSRRAVAADQSFPVPSLRRAGYTVWLVTRSRICRRATRSRTWPTTTGLIADEFDGKVDLVLGESSGGRSGSTSPLAIPIASATSSSSSPGTR